MDGGERGGPDGVILRRRAGRGQIEAKNDSERNGKETTTGECGFHGDTLIWPAGAWQQQTAGTGVKKSC
jgi:hypothetical protein